MKNDKHATVQDAPAPAPADTDRSWKTVEITQDCAYGWTPDNIDKLLKDWSAVKDYAYILHDKDKKEDMTERDPHTHLMLRFKYAVHTSAILARAKACSLPDGCITPNRLEKMKSWSAALNYLTHRDEHKPWKHVYDLKAVISNFDWRLDAESAHQKKLLQTTDARAREIVEGIDKAHIREYNINEHLTIWEQVQYSAQINKAFKAYIDREKLKGERNMEVMFISGASGVGKDAFAVDWCKKNNLAYYRTNNNPEHPFDDYKGQPAIIWSDARDNVFSPSQLFALLDNHWKSSQKARYSDINLDCQMLIITSIKPLTEWYKDAFDNAKDADGFSEPRKQLYRRVKAWANVDTDKILMRVYNQAKDAYTPVMSIPNTFAHTEDYLDTPEKMLQYASMMFSGYKNATQELVNYAKENNPKALEKFSQDLKSANITPSDLSDGSALKKLQQLGFDDLGEDDGTPF